MKSVLHWTLIVIAVFVTLFVMQNMGRTEVALLFWMLNPHLSVVILMSFACGFIAGWIVRLLRRQSRKARELDSTVQFKTTRERNEA